MADAGYSSQTESRDGSYYKNGRVLVPDSSLLKKQCVAEHHSSPHTKSIDFGYKKKLRSIQLQFVWPGILTSFSSIVTLVKSKRCLLWALQPLQIPEDAWASLIMDIINQLPIISSGKNAIAVFVDRLSKRRLCCHQQYADQISS